jgi:predicted S18 family serine protease
MVEKIIALIAVAALFAALGMLYFQLPVQTKIVEKTIIPPPEVIYKTVEKNVTVLKTVEVPVKNYTPKTARFHGIGVYENATGGELVNMSLTLSPGEGRILADVTERTYGADLQDDLIFIKKYVEYYANENLSHYDITVRIDSSAHYIDGLSGSAAMGVGLISLLQNRTMEENVVLTGVLMGDGSIGKVDGLDQKINVSDSLGLAKIYIPQSQCITNKNVSIQIICVGDITAALNYMAPK